MFLCTRVKPSTPAASNANESESDKPSLIAVKVHHKERPAHHITNLQKLKAAQQSENADHPTNKYFPKLYEVHDTMWYAMEAIQGATLSQLAPMIRHNGEWGAMFTCHLFLELHAAMTSLLNLGLLHTDLSPDNVMFRHIPSSVDMFPRLILVDLNLRSVVDAELQAMSTHSLLYVCGVGKTNFGVMSKSFPLSEVLEHHIDTWSDDLKTLKELDTHIRRPGACGLEFHHVGSMFGEVVERLRSQREKVPFPRELKELLEKPLIPKMGMKKTILTRRRR